MRQRKRCRQVEVSAKQSSIMEKETSRRIALGRVYMTPGAARAMADAGDTVWTFLWRHQLGNWGDVNAEDKQANNNALANDGRLLSAYHTRTGVKLWVITEWDRSATTVALPEEY